jgi:Uncharacterized conserved protein
MLKGAYIEKVLSNEKKATIRKGIYKPKYSEVIIHAGGRPIAKARITRVYYKKLKEIGDYEAKLEGLNSASELLKELRKVYGDVKENDYFTVIEFKVLQRLDNLPTEDPYYGLTPSDIARIALRYLSEELNEIEKKVLMDLTRTNSIRRTAVNIFKDLSKEHSLEELSENAENTIREELDTCRKHE